MSELQYSDQEIDEVWNDLNEAKKELEELERKNQEPKKELIIRIRDKVEILVLADKIKIDENQISDKVKSILIDAGVTYSKGHWYELFKPSQIKKRNYSVAPQGAIHEHEFKIVTESSAGKWEKCNCGTNRLNGIEQLDKHEDNDLEEDTAKNTSIRETMRPEGISFDYLKLKREQFSQCIHAIDTIFQKCTLDITSIKKQTTENKKRRAPQIEYEKLYNSTKLLVDKRTKIVTDELKDIDNIKISEAKKALAEIMNSIKKLNDRTKITSYEKAVAKILINKFGYLNGDIASILNITTKHVKNNILKLNTKSPHDQDGLLEQLDYLVRCPGCGLGIADYFENQYESFKQGKPIHDDFDLNSFPLPTYAEQVIDLKQTIRKQKIMMVELKNRLKK